MRPGRVRLQAGNGGGGDAIRFGLHDLRTCLIVRRWQLFTGRHALHQASGQLFVERIETQHRG